MKPASAAVGRRTFAALAAASISTVVLPSPATAPATSARPALQVVAPPPSPSPSPLPPLQATLNSSKPLGERRIRRPAFGGLAELQVDSTNGYEVLTLPAAVVDAAPAPLSKLLKKVQVRERKISDTELFLAGLLGGCSAEIAKTIVLHPIDTAKTRAQAQTIRRGDGGSGGGGACAEDDEPTDGAPAVMPSEAEALGSSPIGLFDRPWAGLGPALATAAPQAGVFFATRDVVRRELGSLVASSQLDGTLAGLLAITAASCGYWAVRAPSEVFKLRQQAEAAEATAEAAAERAEGMMDANPAASDAQPDEEGAMLAMTSADEDDLPATFFDVKEMAPATDPPPQLPAYEPSDYLQLAIAAFPACVAADLPAIFARVLAFQSLRQSDWLVALTAASTAAASSPSPLPPLLVEELLTVGIACVVALLTTPIDVVRTRTLQRVLSSYESYRLFRTFDTDGTRDLDASELRAMLRAKGIECDDERAKELLQRYDDDRSDRLDLGEFRKLERNGELRRRGVTAGGGGGGAEAAAISDLKTLVEREGVGVLFAGAAQRVLWSGLCIGATQPLRANGYYWVRDSVILELFEKSTTAAAGLPRLL